MNNLQHGLDVSLKFLHVIHPFNQVSLAIQDKDCLLYTSDAADEL